MDPKDRGDDFVAEQDDLPPFVETPEPEVIEPEVIEATTPEPEAEAEEPPRDEKGKFIPLNRHEKVLEKERTARETAEREVQELRAAMARNEVSKSEGELQQRIVELRKEKAAASLDGEVDRVVELETQIDTIRDHLAIQRATDMSDRAKNEAREEIRFDAAVESLEKTYPAFNPKDEAFDQDLVDIVVAQRDAIAATEKLPLSQALLKAAEKVLGRLSKPVAADTTTTGLAKGKKAGEDRKAAQVAKNIAAAKAQPASMKELGADSDKAGITGEVNYAKLTREERAAMPEATRARLRGDLIEEEV